MNSHSGHPRYWIAIGLLLLTGQTGLYRIYLVRPGSTAVMAGGLLFAVAIVLAAPSKVTTLFATAILIALTMVVLVDLLRMKDLVKQAHDMGAIDRANASTSIEDKTG